MEGDLPLGRCDVDMGRQGAFQVGVVYETQGEVKGGESIEGLRVIQCWQAHLLGPEPAKRRRVATRTEVISIFDFPPVYLV